MKTENIKLVINITFWVDKNITGKSALIKATSIVYTGGVTTTKYNSEFMGAFTICKAQILKMCLI